jgi:hypothetical protein
MHVHTREQWGKKNERIFQSALCICICTTVNGRMGEQSLEVVKHLAPWKRSSSSQRCCALICSANNKKAFARLRVASIEKFVGHKFDIGISRMGSLPHHDITRLVSMSATEIS